MEFTLGHFVTCITAARRDPPYLDAITDGVPMRKVHVSELSSSIRTACDLHATAILGNERYVSRRGKLQRWATEMLDYVISEGRLFALKPSDWSILLVGVMLCGMAALIF